MSNDRIARLGGFSLFLVLSKSTPIHLVHHEIIKPNSALTIWQSVWWCSISLVIVSTRASMHKMVSRSRCDRSKIKIACIMSFVLRCEQSNNIKWWYQGQILRLIFFKLDFKTFYQMKCILNTFQYINKYIVSK